MPTNTQTHTQSGAHESIMYALHAIWNNTLKMSAQIPVMKMYDVSPLKNYFIKEEDWNIKNS